MKKGLDPDFIYIQFFFLAINCGNSKFYGNCFIMEILCSITLQWTHIQPCLKWPMTILKFVILKFDLKVDLIVEYMVNPEN